MEKAKFRGIATDEQIAYWVKHGAIPSNWNRFLRTFIAAYEGMGLNPLGTQGIVGIADANLATPYDLLMRDKRGNLFIIENKTNTTGGPAFEDAQGKMMRGALAHVPCSAKNRAVFQAAVTQLLYNRCAKASGQRASSGFYVVRAGRKRDDADVYGVEPWVADGLRAVEAILRMRIKRKAVNVAKKLAEKAAKKAAKAAEAAAAKEAKAGSKRKAAAAAGPSSKKSKSD